ncbi:MAG TPA: type II toxin-antitoxin system VapC family toxin [Candidatus Sulfotelmatobacter sp.]|nr:type II toxin-antitoxin system VapC family toxin [Candidatus Sulfotelmatobacter sp.]
MTAYTDTSFLVSLYLPDSNSHIADRMIRGAAYFPLTPLHRAEWVHATGQNVFRGAITGSRSRELRALFERDAESGLWRDTTMPEQAFDHCADLARRYGAKFGMRPLDSLHVACALELKAERFWTFDERQAKLAKAMGLKVS